jgi:hypothetical protein
VIHALALAAALQLAHPHHGKPLEVFALLHDLSPRQYAFVQDGHLVTVLDARDHIAPLGTRYISVDGAQPVLVADGGINSGSNYQTALGGSQSGTDGGGAICNSGTSAAPILALCNPITGTVNLSNATPLALAATGTSTITVAATGSNVDALIVNNSGGVTGTGRILLLQSSGTNKWTVDNTGAVVQQQSLTIAAGGETITAGGLTITAGGETISAGGLTISAGGATITGSVSVSGQLSTTPGNNLQLGGHLTENANKKFAGTCTLNASLVCSDTLNAAFNSHAGCAAFDLTHSAQSVAVDPTTSTTLTFPAMAAPAANGDTAFWVCVGTPN